MHACHIKGRATSLVLQHMLYVDRSSLQTFCFLFVITWMKSLATNNYVTSMATAAVARENNVGKIYIYSCFSERKGIFQG